MQKFYFTDVTIGQDYELITALLGFHWGGHAGKVTGLAVRGRYNQKCIDKIKEFLADVWKRRHRKGYENTWQYYYKAGVPELRNNIRHSEFGEFSDEDIAFAIQHITEEKILWVVRQTQNKYQKENIVLAGGNGVYALCTFDPDRICRPVLP